MQSFFKLANVIPVEDTINYLKDSLKELWQKGGKIVSMNNDAIDRGVKALVDQQPVGQAVSADEIKAVPDHLQDSGTDECSGW